MATGPRCLRWRFEIPSGPWAGEFFDCLIASETWVVVKGMNVDGGRLRSDLEIFLASLSGVVGWTEVSS